MLSMDIKKVSLGLTFFSVLLIRIIQICYRLLTTKRSVFVNVFPNISTILILFLLFTS